MYLATRMLEAMYCMLGREFGPTDLSKANTVMLMIPS